MVVGNIFDNPELYLKSSMDRFIDCYNCTLHWLESDLKSSMDRFIAFAYKVLSLRQRYLKSSMDRFIVNAVLNADSELKFKIQYG